MDATTKTQVWKAAGMGVTSIAAGMAVYDSYPVSIAQAADWMWQPFWQAVIQGGVTFGVYRTVVPPPVAPPK